MLTPLITFGQMLDAPGGRSVLEEYLPDCVNAPGTSAVRDLLVGSFIRVTPALRDDERRTAEFWTAVDAVMAPVLMRTHEDADNAPALRVTAEEPGTAAWSIVGEPARWGLLELVLRGPSDGNPFLDVELTADFTCADRTWRVGGFYDGDGTYRLRALAEEEGEWAFVTRSNVAALHGVRGTVLVGPAGHGVHGPVRVDGFHFRYADGTRYRPWGTTAYAWNHQDERMQRATLATLAESPFTKLRMCLFPKHFVYNTDDPDRFPVVRADDGTFDHTRFDLEFFRRLDDQIRALGDLGIQADLILFHPYDRWGFSDLGPGVDDRVVRYVVRRLAGYAHVWWSLANEYDLVFTKAVSDWDRIGETIAAEDPHGHLTSIHNFQQHFDHTRPWITHASVQRVDEYRTAEETGTWRAAWSKPVVVDECAYEGDLEWSWGNISGEEMLRRHWEGAVRGGYVGHGETYHDEDDEIWWAKGGRLVGTSHERIRFLKEVVAASPTGVLEPLPAGFDALWAGVQDRYLVSYHGFSRPRERHVLLPPGRWRAEVLDTWECTVHPLPGVHQVFVLVPLPARPYTAIRLIRDDAAHAGDPR